KPVIIHTLQKFLIYNHFHQIIIPTPQNSINYILHFLNNYQLHHNKIKLIQPRDHPNHSIINIIETIHQHKKLNDEHIILTHHPLTPFLTNPIITHNLQYP
ncbi:glycosyltransferase family protein, partial [Staphylococcus epidermidis]